MQDSIVRAPDTTSAAHGAGAKVGRFLRPGSVRNAVTAAVIAAAIFGAIWYFDRPANALGSRAVSVAASNAPAPKIGREAADFEFVDIQGNSHRLSDYRGQVVWLNFWATWCPPCRAENPDIQTIYDANKGSGLVVLALSLGESRDTVSGYAKRTKLSYPMGLDLTTEIAGLYRIVGIPTHFFIDRNGILRDLRIGGLSKSQMEKKVQQMLAGDWSTK